MSDVKQRSFKDITVVAIYGDGRGKIAMPALRKTAEALPSCKSLLITNTELDITFVEQKIISAPLDYYGYTEFVMYSLHNYIDTEYALIVQHDGWALDAKNWRNEWFDYDYVGAPTHAALLPNGEFSTLYHWCIDNKDYKGALIVQNGGFSLRSKKFLEAPTKHGIMRRRFDEPMMNNEDVQLCCFLRPALEKVGIKFAPDDVAKYFAFEHFGPIHNGFNASKVFGHHSRFRQLLSNGEMLWKLTDEQTKQIMGEEAVKAMFEDHYGYTIHAV